MAKNDNFDIISHYQKCFYTVKATTPEQLEQAYGIRYQVYYADYNWPEHQPDDKPFESDIWDQSAVHALLFHKPSNRPVGYIRVIPLAKSITNTLPLEEHYPNSLIFQDTPIRHLRQGKTGEISRMAILPAFRSRNSDRFYFYEADNHKAETGKTRFPINYLPMTLAFVSIILSMEERLDYSAAMMEPRLARLCLRFGIDLMPIGKAIEYYGLRAPYLIFPESTYRNLPETYKCFFDLLKQELIAT